MDNLNQYNFSAIRRASCAALARDPKFITLARNTLETCPWGQKDAEQAGFFLLLPLEVSMTHSFRVKR